MDATYLSDAPSGGAEAQKEYHNFKNFYSVVAMALVDSITDSFGYHVASLGTHMTQSFYNQHSFGRT